MIHNIFSLPIYEDFFPNYNSIKHNVVEYLCKQFAEGNNNPAVRESYTKSGSVLLRNPKIKDCIHGNELIDFFNFHIHTFWNELGYSNEVIPYIRTHWALMNPPGGITVSHFHLPNPIAGVFYVDAPENSGDIVFEHPMETVLGHQPYKEHFRGFKFDKHFKAEDGKILLFPGFMRHRVEENLSSKNRIIISFDVIYKQELPV